MKQYTKSQIENTVNHWQAVLEKIGSNYKDFYCKKPWRSPARAMNINALKYIDESVMKSQLKLDDVCAFNANSYMNLQRVNESSQMYLDEAQRETKPTSEFIEQMKAYCRSSIGYENSKKIIFDEAFNVECYDPDETEDVFGNIMLQSFPFDTTKHSVQYHVNFLARKAILLGYNFVAYDVVDERIENGHKTTSASMQFEASYFSSNIKAGSILYHVSPKSLTSKILAKGLLPANKNNQGFNYSFRVYCFIDKHDEIMEWYAKESGKRSKKFILTGQLKYEVKHFYEKLQAKASGMLFDTHEFTVFSVDTSKLVDVVFYRDNTFYINDDFIAVYTEQAIKPDAIKVIGEFAT